MLLLRFILSVSLCIWNIHQTRAGRPGGHEFNKGLEWLTRYGYLPQPDPRAAQLQSSEELANAIKTMQRFAGLPTTGEMDQKTMDMMSKPRCSLPDIIGTSELMRRRRRKKRYALSDSVWKKTDLTWHIRSFPRSSYLSRDHVRKLISEAFRAWSKSSALTFRELPSDQADILVDFTQSYHQDSYPFDGPGGTLAHAFFPGEHPVSGDTHFDDEETWIYNPENTKSVSGTDLFAVAVHEFGHALGLAHSSAKESIMIPYYQGPVGQAHLYQLPLDDVMGIEQLYGKRQSGSYPDQESPGLPAPTARPIPDLPPNRPTYGPRLPSPDRCNVHFDAIANIRGEVFFFKKKHFWRMQPTQQLVSLEPAQILRFWNGLPQDFQGIDAVYERANDSQIVFFIGSQYWVFTDTWVNPGYPRPTSDLGLPPGTIIGAVFVWPHNGKTYLIEKDQYWRYDDQLGHVEPGYPKPVTLWKGVPTDLDDVTRWNDGNTYFFKDAQYWRFTGGSVESDASFPRSTAHDWMHCDVPGASSPPAPRHGEGGMCICAGASHKIAPLLACIIIFLWAVC
uniref:Peptidase metallopeptidase domain-containing protein n=1 Tax=Anolis carolinensis TaxID=28377 RepID=H9GGG5_ANOCA|nr:PREDICTED: matrix metalloproteinase-25 [Anolis carolinensis]|eukprot:XP_008119204.1 PREDICTED: matrix metalloproteinase-25 [Anolis carolinensis]